MGKKEVKDMTLAEKLDLFGEEVGIERAEKDDVEYQADIIAAIDGLEDKEWDKLSADCRNWSNEIAKEQLEAAKKELDANGISKAKAAAKKKAKKATVEAAAAPYAPGTIGELILNTVQEAGEKGIETKEIMDAVEPLAIEAGMDKKLKDIRARVALLLWISSNRSNDKHAGALRREPDKGGLAKEGERFFFVKLGEPIVKAKKAKKEEVVEEPVEAKEEAPAEAKEETKEEAPAEKKAAKPKKAKKTKKAAKAKKEKDEPIPAAEAKE